VQALERQRLRLIVEAVQPVNKAPFFAYEVSIAKSRSM
jgi:hypothetical protein